MIYKVDRRLDNLKAQKGKYVLQLEDLKKLQRALNTALDKSDGK